MSWWNLARRLDMVSLMVSGSGITGRYYRDRFAEGYARFAYLARLECFLVVLIPPHFSTYSAFFSLRYR